MKKPIIYRVVVAALAVAMAVTLAALLSGCVILDFSNGANNLIAGVGETETYAYEVGEINEIKVDALCDVRYNSSPSNTVTLVIQPNLAEVYSVAESGGVLNVKATQNITSSAITPILTVSTASLRRVEMSGAGSFTANEKIVADTMIVIFDGAVNGSAEFDVGELSIDMSGVGKLSVSGKAEMADYKLSGVGTLDALELEARDADVVLDGAGTISVNCTGDMSVEADGVGTLEYKGSPNVDIANDGLVNIKKLD